MDTLRNVLLGACLAAVAISVAGGLCPEQKFEKQLRLIFSLLFLTCLGGAVLKSGVSFSLPAFSSSPSSGAAYADVQERLEAQFFQTAQRNAADALKEKLEQNGTPVKEILVTIHKEEDGGIRISEVRTVPMRTEDFPSISALVSQEAGPGTEVIQLQGEGEKWKDS